MARRKKKELPKIDHVLGPLAERFPLRLFPVQEIPAAVAWAERGNIAIHENYHSRRRQSYHVICGDKERLESFCEAIGVDKDTITASEFFRFWHLTWFPPPPESGDDGPKGAGARTKKGKKTQKTKAKARTDKKLVSIDQAASIRRSHGRKAQAQCRPGRVAKIHPLVDSSEKGVEETVPPQPLEDGQNHRNGGMDKASRGTTFTIRLIKP